MVHSYAHMLDGSFKRRYFARKFDRDPVRHRPKDVIFGITIPEFFGDVSLRY